MRFLRRVFFLALLLVVLPLVAHAQEATPKPEDLPKREAVLVFGKPGRVLVAG